MIPIFITYPKRKSLSLPKTSHINIYGHVKLPAGRYKLVLLEERVPYITKRIALKKPQVVKFKFPYRPTEPAGSVVSLRVAVLRDSREVASSVPIIVRILPQYAGLRKEVPKKYTFLGEPPSPPWAYG